MAMPIQKAFKYQRNSRLEMKQLIMRSVTYHYGQK